MIQHKYSESLIWKKLGLVFFVGTISVFLCLMIHISIPYGDEPDFTIQAPRVIETDSRNFTPYAFIPKHYLLYFEKYNCNIETKISGISYHFLGQMCFNDFGMMLSRLFIYSLNVFALTFLSVLLSRNFQPKSQIESYYFQNLPFGVLLSLLLPSYIYYASLFSFESWVLIISTVSVFFLDRILIFLAFPFFAAFFDVGNATLLAGFGICRYSFIFMQENFDRNLTFVLSCMFLVTVFFFGNAFIINPPSFLLRFTEVESLSEAYSSDYGREIVNKYPLIVRPIITLVTFSLLTPGGIFSAIHLLIFTIFTFIFFLKMLISYGNRIETTSTLNKCRQEIFFAISFILAVVFTLPGYANAKYYIFLSPIFLTGAIRYYGFAKCLRFLTITSTILIFNLNMRFFF